MPDYILSNLNSMRWGVVLVLLTFLFGFGLGGAFGAAEDSLKGGLKKSAEKVLDSVYKGDAANMKAVISKSWTYYKRAHLHAGAMGSAALSMILLLALLAGREKLKGLIAFLFGFGGLGYSVFWLLAGCRAPALGGTDVAKESLTWLAIPSSGGFILALLLTLVVFVLSLRSSTSSELR